MREGSRRGSSSDPAGSSSAQPGLAEAGGERGRLGLTERERESERAREGWGSRMGRWERKATAPRCGRSALLQRGPGEWEENVDLQLDVGDAL